MDGHDLPRAGARFQIVSPPFACGVTWLVNALLELDIRATNAGFEPGHWARGDGGWTMSERAEQHLKWHLPVLHRRRSFAFPEDIDVAWEHRLDFAGRGAAPTILFVRDPRDAVHSLYRRNRAHEIDFESYLKKEDEWPDHFPGLFQLPPLETFAYFCWFWLAMNQAMPVAVVRFEDVKAAPHDSLKAVLRFLGIERPDDRIDQAVESSSFDSARRAMVSMEEQTGTAFKTVRKGEVGEWKSAYPASALKDLGRSALDILAPLGYEDPRPGPAPAPVFDDCRAIVARTLPRALRAPVADLITMTEAGHPPPAAAIAALAAAGRLAEPALTALAAVAQAIYYVRRVFADTSTPPARIALNTFVNLNLSYLGEAPVRSAAVRRMQQPCDGAEAGEPQAVPEPAERSVFGFDIVGCGARYFAVPPGTPAAAIEAIASGTQACAAAGGSIAEVKIRLLAGQRA